MEVSPRQYLIVVRHGLRQDELDSRWAQQAQRPWDPPLAEAGNAQILELAKTLQKFGISRIVSSPYLRCLATASKICHALGTGIAQVEIDNSLSEIAAKPYFVGEGPRAGQAFQDWMWGGQTPQEGWKLGLGVLPGSDVGCSFPAPNESLAVARKRYAFAIEAAADRANGANALLVTHGEAVGSSVTRLHPTAVVHAVQHCGFTVAWRELDEDGDWSLWHLEGSSLGNATGVAWRDPAASQYQ